MFPERGVRSLHVGAACARGAWKGCGGDGDLPLEVFTGAHRVAEYAVGNHGVEFGEVGWPIT